MDSGYYKGTCPSILIAAQFTIAKLWKQPKFPTTDEWIKKMWFLPKMEFYSATMKNENLSFASKCMELENILKQIIQAQKAKNHMFSHKCINVIRHRSHIKGRTCMGRIGKVKET
jgi:hypothetical protein